MLKTKLEKFHDSDNKLVYKLKTVVEKEYKRIILIVKNLSTKYIQITYLLEKMYD